MMIHRPEKVCFRLVLVREPCVNRTVHSRKPLVALLKYDPLQTMAFILPLPR
jgi:hypothetical protein